MDGITGSGASRNSFESQPMDIDPRRSMTPDQFFRKYESRMSVDEYPSYGGTPTATPARTSTARPGTPCGKSWDGEAPRRSASVILKGLANLSSGKIKSGRLSDADDLQAQYNSYYVEDIISARVSNASPMRIPFSMAGAIQIPEADLFNNAEDARAHALARECPADEGHDSIDVDLGRPVRDENPPLRIYVKFTDVRHSAVVQQPAKWTGKPAVEKEIIHGVTGSVAPGEMLAMMGPSGSGKTTLLNLLSGKRSPQQGSGSTILYNNLPYTKNLKRRIGLVTQDDVLFPHLTVRETLSFSAILRLPKSLSREQKVERAEDVIKQLGLQKCGDTVIGNQFLRGVSGGERKRVCIGQEILIDPSLILLDEPTSGLDSTTALRIIQLLQNIALQSRTVITSIHQPSSRAFHMFDKLILLSEGHLVYYGKARGAMTYFDSIGFAPHIPMNPADFLLDLCSGNVKDMSVPTNQLRLFQRKRSKLGRVDSNPVPATPSTQMSKDVKKYLVDCCEIQITATERSKLSESQGMAEELKAGVWEKRKWGTTWWEQFLILFIRGLKERRHEYLSPMRTVQVVLSALLAGSLWWQSKHETPQQLQDQVGLIFFIAVFWGYFPLFTSIFSFPLERAVLAKERGSDMYRLSAYFMARTLGDLPLDLSLPLSFILIVYFMANLRRTAAAFFFTNLTVFLTVITSQGLGFLIGAAMMDVQKATTLASVVILAFMLAGGFFVRRIPPFIGWIKYVSFQSHTYNILLKVQYSHEKNYNCSAPGGCQSVESAPALSNNSVHGIGKSVSALLAMVFGYRILAYLALRRMKTSA